MRFHGDVAHKHHGRQLNHSSSFGCDGRGRFRLVRWDHTIRMGEAVKSASTVRLTDGESVVTVEGLSLIGPVVRSSISVDAGAGASSSSSSSSSPSALSTSSSPSCWSQLWLNSSSDVGGRSCLRRTMHPIQDQTRDPQGSPQEKCSSRS